MNSPDSFLTKTQQKEPLTIGDIRRSDIRKSEHLIDTMPKSESVG
tara:strand:+ start:5894 stop:6028 length:135 start_codon:yes stop_codon:yes gene_type:complete